MNIRVDGRTVALIYVQQLKILEKKEIVLARKHKSVLFKLLLLSFKFH